jgi:integrase
MDAARSPCPPRPSLSCGLTGGQQQTDRLALGAGKSPPNALVFSDLNGEPRLPNAITKEWERTARAAGLAFATLHSLRHTHASHLIANGLDILTISRRLGHGSPTITLSVYRVMPSWSSMSFL